MKKKNKKYPEDAKEERGCMASCVVKLEKYE